MDPEAPPFALIVTVVMSGPDETEVGLPSLDEGIDESSESAGLSSGRVARTGFETLLLLLLLL